MKSKITVKPKEVPEIIGGMIGLEEIISSSMDLSQETARLMAEKMIHAGMDDVANGSLIETAVNKHYQKYVKILRTRLITEYNAQSVSERMLVDMSINAYFQYLHASRLYDNFLATKDGYISYNQMTINMIKELNKRSEAAHRQFMSALATLREMKRPKINIKVHSEQAFIAENQQFNKNA